jgi:catabolite regulation protein CreA
VQALTASLATSPLVALPDAAFADKRTVGEISTSGLIFKDKLKIEAFDDPKVSGINLYLSDFERPVTEKLAKGDVFSDPSSGGLSCSRSGKVVVSATASFDKGGEEVFSEARSLVFKSLKVRRVIDKPGKSVVYAVYSQRLDKKEDSNNSRFKSSLCAVPVDTFEEPPAQK